MTARPVPAIGASSWAAAGNRFFAYRFPRPLPIEYFNRAGHRMIGNDGIAQGIISGAGTATVAVGPQGFGTRWYPNQLSIATQTGAVDASTAQFYLNVIPGGFLGQSYAGGGDQPGIALPEMQPGDQLYTVWAGGNPGDWCQVTLTGPMEFLTTSPLCLIHANCTKHRW